MKITIATWNMAYWTHPQLLEETWEYLLNDINPDFILCQEAKRPKFLQEDPNFIWHNAGETKGHNNWGTGIYSKNYPLTQEPDESIPCWNIGIFNEMCVVANTSVDDTDLTLISLYGRMDKIGSEGYSIPNLQRVLSDLTGILNGHFGKRNIVFGGDFNASEQIDQNQPNDSHRLFFERVKDFKLEDSFELNGHEDYVQTLRHIKSEVNWQNDYIFLGKPSARKFVSCEVIDNEMVRKYSDHNIVVVTLDL